MGDQKGKLSHPETISETNKEKTYSSFLARTQPMKNQVLFLYYDPHSFLFPLCKNSSSLAAGVQPRWIQGIQSVDSVGMRKTYLLIDMIRLRNNSVVGKLSGGRGLNNLDYAEDQ